MSKPKAARTRAYFRAEAISYIEKHFETMRKFGTEPRIMSPQEYDRLVDEVAAVGRRLWESSGGEIA